MNIEIYIKKSLKTLNDLIDHLYYSNKNTKKIEVIPYNFSFNTLNINEIKKMWAMQIEKRNMDLFMSKKRGKQPTRIAYYLKIKDDFISQKDIDILKKFIEKEFMYYKVLLIIKYLVNNKIENHIIINPVNIINGKMFRSTTIDLIIIKNKYIKFKEDLLRGKK